MTNEPACSICYGSVDTYCFAYNKGDVSILLDPTHSRKSPSYFTYNQKRSWGNYVISADYNKMILNINEYLQNPKKQIELKYKFFDEKNEEHEEQFNIIQVLSFILTDICKWHGLNANKIIYIIPFSWLEEEKEQKTTKHQQNKPKKSNKKGDQNNKIKINGKYALEVITRAAKISNKELFIMDTLSASVFDYLIRANIENECNSVFIDFGETHFDVGIVKLLPNYKFKILYKDTSHSINGKNLTYGLMKVVIEKYIEKGNSLSHDALDLILNFQQYCKKDGKDKEDNIDIFKNIDFYNFYYAIKKLKEDLSSSTQILFQPITVNHGEELNILVDREEFIGCPEMKIINEEIKEKLGEISSTKEITKEKNLVISLQGGSVRIPCIRELIAKQFNQKSDDIPMIINTVESFAEGGAYYYEKHLQEPESYKFEDISKFDLSEMSKKDEDELRQKQNKIDEYEKRDLMIAEAKNSLQEYYFKMLKFYKSRVFKEYPEEQQKQIKELIDSYEYVQSDIDSHFEGKGYSDIVSSLSNLKNKFKEITGDENINLKANRKPTKSVSSRIMPPKPVVESTNTNLNSSRESEIKIDKSTYKVEKFASDNKILNTTDKNPFFRQVNKPPQPKPKNSNENKEEIIKDNIDGDNKLNSIPDGALNIPESSASEILGKAQPEFEKEIIDKDSSGKSTEQKEKEEKENDKNKPDPKNDNKNKEHDDNEKPSKPKKKGEKNHKHNKKTDNSKEAEQSKSTLQQQPNSTPQNVNSSTQQAISSKPSKSPRKDTGNINSIDNEKISKDSDQKCKDDTNNKSMQIEPIMKPLIPIGSPIMGTYQEETSTQKASAVQRKNGQSVNSSDSQSKCCYLI